MTTRGRASRGAMSGRSTKPRLAAGAVALAILLAGCTSGGDDGGVAAAANGKGNSSGSGVSLRQIAPAKRGTPMDVSGTLLTGQPWSTADAKGKVVVFNVWGSWCGPCQAESPELQSAWTKWQAAKKPVVLMGVNVKESASTGLAFMKQRGLTYPSLKDDGGKTELSLGNNVRVQPTTLVLDKQHRLAAVVPGEINERTLLGLVDDAISGK